MGKYFTNETLDGLWTRLVGCVQKMANAEILYNYEIIDAGQYGYARISGNKLYLSGEGDWTFIGDDIPGVVQPTYHLGHVEILHGTWLSSTPGAWGEDDTLHISYYEELFDAEEGSIGSKYDSVVIKRIANMGLKTIHNELLYHTQLTRDTLPSTPGDYMKGIAVVARYKKYGTEEPYMSWSLEQIVEELEDTSSELPIFTLDETLYLTASKEFEFYGDLFLTLYRNGEYFGSIYSADGTIPFDFLHTSYWTDYPPPTFSTGTYYATIGWYSDENMAQYNSAKSNEIYVADVPTRYTVTLNVNGDYSLTPSAGDATLVLYDVTRQESQTIISASPVGSGNLSEYMTTGHQYYIIVRSITNDPDNGTYRSETITYSGPAITVTLSQDGIASSNITTDPDWYLYNAITDEWIYTELAALSPVDFSSHMNTGNSYYVIVSGVRSNTITYSGEEPDPAISVTLNSSGIATVVYTGFTPASAADVYWTLYNGAGDSLVYDATYDSMYTHDFSSYMTNGALYKVEVSAYDQSIDSTRFGSSGYVEYLGGGDSDIWISATLSKTQLSDDIRFNVNYSYSSSDLYIEDALITLYSDALSETVVSEWRAPINGNSPDVASFTFLATDLYTNYVYDSQYRLTITTYKSILDNDIWDTTSTEFTWPFEQGGGGSTTPSYSSDPNASMTDEGYIYVSNYSTEEYNGSEVIVYSSWSYVDGGSQTETDWGSLSYGYVMLSDGVYFEGEPYMSEASYSIIIRDPNDETNSTAEARVTKPLN